MPAPTLCYDLTPTCKWVRFYQNTSASYRLLRDYQIIMLLVTEVRRHSPRLKALCATHRALMEVMSQNTKYIPKTAYIAKLISHFKHSFNKPWPNGLQVRIKMDKSRTIITLFCSLIVNCARHEKIPVWTVGDMVLTWKYVQYFSNSSCFDSSSLPSQT